MSFKFNSDKEQIRASAPQIIGDNEISLRSGTGTDEKEVLRALIEPTTKVPRVGINRTGNRIDTITVDNPGSGYTTQPTVTVSAPLGDNPVQAAASASISPEGRVAGILIDNPGAGYTTAPTITISGGNGVGATATAFLDTVDFELDINGAIRTSTSIISDTARILNLDIDNLVTPDAAQRAPNLKTFMNNTGTPWAPDRLLQQNTFVFRGPNVYQSLNVGTTSSNPLDPPLHTDGIEINGNPLDNPVPGVQFKHIGFRVSDPNEVFYNTSGETGIYPRSITPLLGDKSDKIATTEYVLNLATNDVGGRIYVSQLIGDDNNDGRSPVNPVRTIKKACQLAWETPGVKESIIIAGGDYTEDNPMSLPPDASIVGDNLRLVIIRPANPRKHIFKFGDKNYVIGVTYRDQEGADTFTWDFAMVFDDKQRITYDFLQNGDAGTQFPVGHQIFGESVFRTTFQSNGGLNNLVAGIELRGVNAGGIVTSRNVQFDDVTGNSAFVNGSFDFVQTSGSVNAGETLVYGGANSQRFQPLTAYTVGQLVWTEDHVYNVTVAGTSGETNPTHDTGAANNGTGTLEFTYIRDTYSLVTTDIISIRPEGEVVFENRPNLTDPPLPISRIDFSLQGDPSIATGGFGDYGTPEDLGGIIFYTNPLVESDNIHDFKEGEEILIQNLSTSAPDLSMLNGKQRIYKVIEDPDGRSRRFVIPKKLPSLTNNNYDPGQFAQVQSFSKSVTLSLLNSPFKFQEATPVARRFQDASLQIRNNREFIADEVVGRINDEFSKDFYSVYEIGGSTSQTLTPSDVTYDAATGDLVFTSTAHGFDVGTGISIADNSLTFTCAMDNNATEHSYPRPTDPGSGRALPILSKTNDTFTVNVGASPADQDFTPQSGTSYDPATGDLVLEIGTHSLPVGGSVIIDNNSLSFTCDMDNRDTAKTYPRPGIDPASNRSVKITSKTATGITVNIGASASNKYFQPTNAVYTPSTGEMVLTIGQHGLGVGRNITIENNSLTFTCLQDPSSPKTYPRPGIDPYADKKSIAITAVGSTQHDVTDAPYDAATGNITLQVANHGFSDGDYIKIADGALSYTCVLDGNTVTKTYPRAGFDPASNRWLEISNVTQNTFDVNVGQSSYTGSHTYVGGTSSNAIDHQDGTITINVGVSSNTTTHTFTGATANAIKHEPQSQHYFEASTADAVKFRPQVAHTFVRSASNSLSTGGDSFKIFLGASRFAHTYVSGGTVKFGGVTYNVTDFQYDHAITGNAVVTVNTSIPGIAEDSIIELEGVVVECVIDGVTTQKTYPSFSIPISDEKCKRDIRYFLDALIQDLEFGSNNNIIDGAKKYIDATNTFIDTTIDFEIIQTVRAIEYARELAIFAMRKWRTGNGLVSDPVYTPVYSSLPRYFDPTIIDDLNAGGACNNVKSAIDTLAYLFVDVLANNASGTYLDAAYLIARNRDHIVDEAYNDAINQFPSLNLNNVDERKCRRDINLVISALLKNLVLGGNDAVVTYAELYFTGTELTGVPASELPATRYAFTAARDLCIEAMRNWNDSSGNPTTASFTPIPRFTDPSILADPLGNPLCAQVEATITTLFGVLDDILGSVVAPGATTKTTGTLLDTAGLYNYADSVITDFNGNKVTVKSTYDDFPIIEASPYTQNASIISKLGGGGALVDGSKVKQPNCPFPGLNLDGTAKFPNQGKSMVASAFTIVSEGGVGYKIIEDGYVQLVSVFCIFTADGILAESGGYASVTNSASNFGIYSLRARGFRRECYDFDQATISNVSSTPTGRTIFSVSGLGREPLEHYVVKIDGFVNTDPEIEYFVDAVEGVTVGPPFSAQLTLESGAGGPASFKSIATDQVVSLASLVGENLKLHRPSIVNSSSHTWEYAGSGTTYLALPENGGTKIEANEQVSEDYGRTYVSGTDELGDFKVGTFARIENRTGNITFTGTVTISEVEFLKLKGGDVVVTGFDNSNTLGGANASDSKLPTQKAVKDYITNNLGPYINKPFSTNAVPRALVELTDSGKISLDQIPALRPFSVFTVADQAERLALEGALAGDIAIQQDTQTSFILNNDLTSLFLGFAVDSSLSFTIGDVFTGTPSTGRIQSTEYRQGVLFKINITDGGSGYTVAPTVTISGGNPSSGAVAATATATIANGEVVTITINENAGYVGGYGYTTQPTITIQAPPGAGTQATATSLIESRLYGNIVNNIKMLDTDTFDDSSSPSANTVNITRVINTSAFTASNWVSLSSDSVGVSSLTGPGVISTTLLGSEAANSFTFLRGDSRYAKVVQSLKGAETRYFARLHAQASTGASSFIFQTISDVLKGHDIVASVAGIAADTSVNGVTVVGGLTTVSFNNPITATIPVGTVIEFNRGASPLIFDSTNTGGEFIDSIVIANGGTGFTDGQYFDVPLDAPAGNNGVDLRANIIVGENGQNGVVTTCTVTNAGSGYTSDFQVTPNPTIIGSGSNLVLLAKVATTQKQFANIAIDVQRVSDLTISQDLFGTIGVSRYKKSQFNLGVEGNGSVSIKMGPDSGLDADLLDGQQGAYYLNGAFFVDSSIVPDKLASGVYSIDISGRSTNTLRLDTGTSNANANPGPSDAVQGITLQTLFNSSNGLLSAFPSVDTGSVNSAKHLVMTLRNGETGGDATFGGVRQLAFANDDRIYFRGSGDAVTSYGSWYEVWNSGNQGIDSGLDADKLDNKQGVWYQDARNIKDNEIFDTRLPVWRSSTKFRDKVEVSSYGGTDVFYRILVRQNLDISPGGDFEVTNTIDIFDTNKISVGDFTITATDQVVDQNDSANTYTILIGRLASGGNITAAVYLGVAGDERQFEQWEIYDANTIQYAEFGNDSGTGFLRLGRKDGNAATNPYIYFNSSQTAALYNSAIIADGGNGTTGSGSLEFKVVNENELKVNNNIIWNAGNVAFNDTNVASTTSLKSAVMRDTNGDFAAGTITAALTGAASLNVLKTGDTMTGGLTITGNNDINVQGTGALTVGGTGSVGSNFTVDGGVFYVNATDNVVNVGQTTNSNNTTFNVYDGNGNNEFSTSLALSSQRSLYFSSVFNQVDSGESGLILQHGASAAAQWGISTHRTGSSVGELIIRTRTGGSSSATRLVISNGGNVLAGADSDQDLGSDGTRWQNVYSDITHALNSVRIAKGTANQEADIQLRGGGSGAGGGRGFRLGTNIGGGPDLFEIYASQTNGSDNWKSLANPVQAPALAIQGTNNRVGINTNSFSGTDTSTTPNTNRNYILNVQGDMNLNGQFFQNNEEFVTSRWTESSNDSGANIYRNSKVGIGNVPSPAYTLDVAGDFNMTGVMRVNGTAQWFDSYGVIRGSNQTIAETVTIPNGAIASSNGPITIVGGGGHVVTIGTGATWVVR